MGLMDMFKSDTTNDVPNTKHNTAEENQFITEINKNQLNAEATRGIKTAGNGSVLKTGIEQIWEDEYKMFVGDQWDTSFAKRSPEAKKTRPNSVDNFIFPAVINQLSTICSSVPEVTFEGTESDSEDGDDDNKVAEELTYLARFNDRRNNFRALWKKMVLQFISYGPVIGAVMWDNEWMGGTGPDRWIGDVRILNINRKEIFFDPAIIDLEERLQECAFIHRKFRKKLSYIKDRWENGKYVNEENNTDKMQDEGEDPKQAYVVEAWHRGKPKFVPEESKKRFLQKAQDLLPPNEYVDYFKAQEYKDMAAGKLDGVHVAYISNNVFLEYRPYEYEDGLYPFVYKTLYYDENSQYGFGEIRNIKVPQVMHNKADEIEIEAMSREGLGGMYYGKGALTQAQKTEIVRNNAKGGQWLEVDNVNALREREGVKVPQSIDSYKEHKQRMVETISGNTPIQQGMAPGSNLPYKAIAELGARTDVKTKAKVEILEDFLTEINRLRLNRFAQFYTEDRYYRIKGSDGKVKQGTFNREKMLMAWEREVTNEETGVIEKRLERYIPDFDIIVKVSDEKPTDRNYYTNTAFELHSRKAMDLESLWYTLEEGKFPPKEEVISRVESQDQMAQILNTVNQLPPEAKQAFFNVQNQMLQNLMQGIQQMKEQPMMQGGESA